VSDPDASQLGSQIKSLLQESRWSEAIPLLNEWTRRFPRQANGWYWKATCLARMRRLQDALKCARYGHSLAPDDQKITSLLQQLEKALTPEVRPTAPAPAGQGPAQSPPARPAAAPEATLVDSGSAPAQAAAVPPTMVDPAPAQAAAAPPTMVDPAPAQAAAVPPTMVDPAPVQAAVAPPTMVDGSASARASVPPTVADEPSAQAPAVPATLAESPEPQEAAEAAGERPDMPAARAASGQWSPGEVVDGRYDIRGKARGGMGEVFFVFDRELGIDIAVKTPLPAAMSTEAGRSRFFREAEAWIALGLHPNICTAYYVRELDGLPRLFIEYVGGGTLEDWLQDNPEAAIADRLDLAIQIAAGVHHAHTFTWQDEDGGEHRGVVHRDLKPANVLLGGDLTARVTDFGLVGRGAADGNGAEPAGPSLSLPDGMVEATLVDDGSVKESGGVWGTMTMGGSAMGTPPYMAPEQWSGAHTAGVPADIYAFGCVLYELLCGTRPFSIDPKYQTAAPDAQRMLWERAHREQEPPDPRSIRADLDRQLAELMLACLAKEPGHRPPSFAEIGRVLKGIYNTLVGRAYPRPEPEASRLLADSLNNRGVSYASLGQGQRAERAWQEALQADPQHIQASFNLALLGWRIRGVSDQDLINRMEEVRRTQTGDWRDEHLAGKVALSLGRYSEALTLLRSAAGGSDSSPEVIRDLALALAAVANESGDNDLWRRAGDRLARFAVVMREDAATLTCRALAAGSLGDSETCQRLWSEARQRFPELPEDLQGGAEQQLPGACLRHRPTAFAGHLYSAAVSADGSTGLTGGDSGTLNLWNLRSGELIRNLRGPDERVGCVALVSPDLALSAVKAEPVCVWNLRSGSLERRLQTHTGHLSSLVVSGNGQVAAGIGSAGTLTMWDIASGKRMALLKVHEGFAACVVLSDDGALAVSGGGDGRIRVVDPAGKRCLASIEAHDGPVAALFLSADQSTLLSGGEDGVVKLWDLRQQACISTLKGHAGPIRFVSLATNGQRALSASVDGTLRMWSLQPLEPLSVEQLKGGAQAGAASGDWSAVLVSHGTTLSLLSLKETPSYRPSLAVALLVTASEAQRRDQLFRSHIDEARRQAEQQQYVAAYASIERARSVSGYERATEALDLANEIGAMFPRKTLLDGWEEHYLQGHSGALTCCAVSRRGPRAISAGRDQKLILWDRDKGEALATVTSPSVTVAVAFLGGRREVVTADLDSLLRFWDMERKECTQELGGHEGRINALAVDPFGTCILSASDDHSARLWDPQTGSCQHQLMGHDRPVTAAAVSPDGIYGVTGGDDGSLLIWDLVSGRSRFVLEGHTDAILHLVWSSDGRHILSTSRDSSVRLWEASTGRLLRTFEEDLSTPTRCSLSADGRFALIGESSGRLSMWDLRRRSCLRAFDGHTEAVASVVMTPNGRQALSAGNDGSLRIWRLEWEPQIRSIAEWDEGARPFLEVFLRRHAPLRGARPEWGEDDFRRLLIQLRYAGFGWLRPDGVREHLQELAQTWGKKDETATVRTAAVTPAKQVSKFTPHQRASFRKQIRLALLIAAVLIPLLLGLKHMHSLRQVRFDSDQVKERRAIETIVLVAPQKMGTPVECDRKLLDRYLQDFTQFTDNVGDWRAANYCIEKLSDPRSVAPILNMVRPKPEETSPDLEGFTNIGSDPKKILDSVHQAMSGGVNPKDAARSMLARLDDSTNDELRKALSDDDPEVRAVAAGALALRGSEESVELLLNLLHSPDTNVRRAISARLPTITTSGELDRMAAFAVLDDMAGDDDPRVRLNVVRCLELFDGSWPQSLIEQLAEDEDATVREAARRQLD
jgi:WD40 repeat protein/serine/threonine protein kinase